MSLFKSILPTETQSFLDELAKNKRATLHGVSITPTHEIVVLWEDDSLFTGLTVPVEFPPNMVKAGKLPPKVCKTVDKPKPVLSQAQNIFKPIVAPLQPAPVYLDENGLREAMEKKLPVEYQGIQPVWIAFNPKQDKFTDGFYYRVKQKVDTKPAVT